MKSSTYSDYQTMHVKSVQAWHALQIVSYIGKNLHELLASFWHRACLSCSFCDPSDEVKQLSTEQSATCAGFDCNICWQGFSSRPASELLAHSLETLEINSESWILATSSPAEPNLCFLRTSWAFSSHH